MLCSDNVHEHRETLAYSFQAISSTSPTYSLQNHITKHAISLALCGTVNKRMLSIKSYLILIENKTVARNYSLVPQSPAAIPILLNGPMDHIHS